MRIRGAGIANLGSGILLRNTQPIAGTAKETVRTIHIPHAARNADGPGSVRGLRAGIAGPAVRFAHLAPVETAQAVLGRNASRPGRTRVLVDTGLRAVSVLPIVRARGERRRVGQN